MFSDPVKVAFHARNCMPCNNVLLCRILLHDASALLGRHPDIYHNPQFHHEDAAIPHP